MHDKSADFVTSEAERVSRVLQEMDQVNRLTDELDHADRIWRARRLQDCIPPLRGFDELAERMAAATRPLESLLKHQESLSKMLEPVATPSAFDELGERMLAATSPLESIQKSQESLSRMIKELMAPPPAFEIPKIEFPKGCALTKLQQMSDDEIWAFVDGNPSPIALQKALHELAMRRIDRATRPHWSVTWTFWLVVVSAISSAVAVLLMLR